MDHNPILEAVRGALAGGTGWWVYSTMVGSMPIPRPDERWYGAFYTFIQRVAANHSLINGNSTGAYGGQKGGGGPENG